MLPHTASAISPKSVEAQLALTVKLTLGQNYKFCNAYQRINHNFILVNYSIHQQIKRRKSDALAYGLSDEKILSHNMGSGYNNVKCEHVEIVIGLAVIAVQNIV